MSPQGFYPWRPRLTSNALVPHSVIETNDLALACLRALGLQRTLVLADIDNTKARAKQPLARDEYFRVYSALRPPSLAVATYIAALDQTEVSPVDPKHRGLLSWLTAMPHVVVLGFTNRGPESHQVTERHMKSLGLTFSQHSWLRQHVFAHNKRGRIINGIFYGAGCKDKFFMPLLNHARDHGFAAEQVMHFDDSRSVIDNVAAQARQYNIPHTGFRVSNCDQYVEKLSFSAVNEALVMHEQKRKLLSGPKVYLAGPDVFYPNSTAVGREKVQALAAVGFTGLYPADNCIDNFQRNRATADRIAKANKVMMREAKILLINMTPWHGPSTDCGSAMELGYMACRADLDPSILLVGYTEGEVIQPYPERVAKQVYGGKVTRLDDGGLQGCDGNIIESFGDDSRENLMLQSAIEESGGKCYDSFADAVKSLPELWAKKQLQLEQPEPKYRHGCP